MWCFCDGNDLQLSCSSATCNRVLCWPACSCSLLGLGMRQRLLLPGWPPVIGSSGSTAHVEGALQLDIGTSPVPNYPSDVQYSGGFQNSYGGSFHTGSHCSGLNPSLSGGLPMRTLDPQFGRA